MNCVVLYFKIRTYFAKIIQRLRYYKYKIHGYDVKSSSTFERNIHLDRLYPQGVHIGESCMIASGTTILSHDHCKRVGPKEIDCWLTDTFIGNRCFLAVNCTILPGVKIGDECIVGAGAVVTKDVPPHSIVAGNPAKVIRTNIRTGERGIILNWNIEKGWVD